MLRAHHQKNPILTVKLGGGCIVAVFSSVGPGSLIRVGGIMNSWVKSKGVTTKYSFQGVHTYATKLNE